MLLRFLDTESGRKAMKLAMLGISEHLSKYGMFNARTCRGLVRENCIDGSCCGLVRLYACMGLHRYNLLQGTNLQLVDVKRYNKTVGSPAGSFYITLYATDPSSGNCLTFQTAVNVECCGEFVLTSYVAGPRGTVTNPKALVRDNYRVGSLPECPKENPFENRNRFYQVDESELQSNDWIRLYLELSVAKSDRTTDDLDLSKLKIVKVAIETTEPPSESSLTAKNATVYIRYTDFCEARCGGKNFDRIAVVRRTFVERTGCFSLDGWHESSDIIPETCHQNQNQSSETVRGKGLSLSRKLLNRRLIHKSWRIWRRRAYTNHGVGLAHRRLDKTRSIEAAIKKYSQKLRIESECEPWRISRLCNYS